MSIAKQLNDELQHNNEQENIRGIGPDYFRHTGISHQNTWSPMSTRHHFQHKESRPTIHDLEALYFTLAGQTSNESHHHSSYMPHHHTHHTHSYLFPK